MREKRPIRRIFGLLCLLIFIFLGAACSRQVTQTDLPYDVPETFRASGEAPPPSRWWTSFQDTTLNTLVDTALRANLDLQVVWYQLREARAITDRESGNLLPDLEAQFQSGISRPVPDFVGGENSRLSLRAQYELDLWGRIRYRVHAQQYRQEASRQEYQAAAISLSAEVALRWFRLLAARRQARLLEEQQRTNEKVLQLIRVRFRNGLVPSVDIFRQQQLIKSTETAQINVAEREGMLRNELAVLLGQPPRELPQPKAGGLPALPPLPELGVPLQLVRRRPDVRAAFLRLNAADRELAAAISNKYPRLNFSLTAAVRSNNFQDLLGSQAASLTGGLLAPLFYGGRLQAEAERTEAVKNQATYRYGQTVLTAFQEVENALLQEQKQQERLSVLEERITLAERTYERLRSSYLNGSTDYLDVLTALNQAQQLRRDRIGAQLRLLEVRVALYRSLAGGFQT